VYSIVQYLCNFFFRELVMLLPLPCANTIKLCALSGVASLPFSSIIIVVYCFPNMTTFISRLRVML
jgi:hypothetical protein